MRKCKNPLKFIILIFLALFAINTTAMYVLFDINVFRPGEPSGSGEAAVQESREDAGAGGGYNPIWNKDLKSRTSPDEVTSIYPENSSDKTNNDLFLSEEQVLGLNNLDIKDKLEAVIKISKIPGDEADKIFSMAKDGVTYKELKEIETVLAGYLSSDEINSLKSIVGKSVKSISGQDDRPDGDGE